MRSNILVPIKYIVAISLILILFEVIVEIRAYRRGFDTLFFGKQSLTQVESASGDIRTPIYGPTEYFPFRSRIVDRQRTEKLRIWLSSSSYAEAVYTPPDSIFANLICMPNECEVLNASHAGDNIQTNTIEIYEESGLWKPDIAILYQMSNDIEFLLADYSQPSNEVHGLFDSFVNDMTVLSQRTTLYSHLRNYVGGGILLNSIRPDSLTDRQHSQFKGLLSGYIEETERKGIEPILMTFITAYQQSDINTIPVDMKLQLLRYGGKLSVKGWLAEIKRLNQIIREVAEEKDIRIFDLEKELELNDSYFKDNFHFNVKGHREIAKYLRGKLFQMDEEIASDI